jgi:polysaccharide export outer membrane protein
MRPVTLLILAVVTSLMAGCSSSGMSEAGGGATRTESLPAPDLTSVTGALSQPDYRIGPLDMLEISVFQVADLNKTVQVNSGGQIALPLIGMVVAGGKTVSELEAEIAAKLQASYLQSPQVSVFVKESTSQRVTVDGAVKEPGIVSLTGQMTLQQTIAVSGGLEPGADPSILVFRNIEGKRMAAKFDLKAIRAGKAEDPVVYGGDVIVVDRSGIRAAMSDLKQSIPIFSFFMPMI